MRFLWTIALLALPLLACAQSSKPTARVAPNPVTDRFVLEVTSPENQSFTAELRDLTGTAVHASGPQQASAQSTSIAVDVRTLQRGIYFCRVAFASGEVLTVRVLLE